MKNMFYFWLSATALVINITFGMAKFYIFINVLLEDSQTGMIVEDVLQGL